MIFSDTYALFQLYYLSSSEDERDPSLLRNILLGDLLSQSSKFKRKPEGDMEVTFAPGFSDSTEEKKKTSNDQEEKSPWEKYQEKISQKKKEKREKRKREAEEDEKKEKEAIREARSSKKRKVAANSEEKKKAEELELLMVGEDLNAPQKKGFNLDRLIAQATEADSHLTASGKPKKLKEKGAKVSYVKDEVVFLS